MHGVWFARQRQRRLLSHYLLDESYKLHFVYFLQVSDSFEAATRPLAELFQTLQKVTWLFSLSLLNQFLSVLLHMFNFRLELQSLGRCLLLHELDTVLKTGLAILELEQNTLSLASESERFSEEALRFDIIQSISIPLKNILKHILPNHHK